MLKDSIKAAAARAGLARPLRQLHRIVRGIPLRTWLRHHRITSLYRQFVTPDSLCFDVGANVGIRTAIMRSLGARVVAIEPQLVCRTLLQRRFGKDTGVVIEPVALGATEGHMQLQTVPGISTVASLSPDWPTRSQFVALFQQSQEEKVRVTTLDALIARHGMPSFCKIDVEGYEPEVLAGLSRPLPLVSFEYNCKLLDHTRRAIKRLQALSVTEFNYAPEESMRFVFSRWTDGDTLLARLGGLDPENSWGDVYARHDHTA